MMIVMVLTVNISYSSTSPFATEVVETSGFFGDPPYDDPYSVAGKPATQCLNMPGPWGGNSYRVKLFEPAYNLGTNQEKTLLKLYPNESVVVKFDHKVVDYPGNLYGSDFIVFGNSFFAGSGTYTNDFTDLRIMNLNSGISGSSIRVSVSQDGQTWYDYSEGPYADNLYPTQAYKWDPDLFDRTGNGWTDNEMDFTRPIDPNLTLNDFQQVTAYQAFLLYDGSGGGTSYDLKNLSGYQDMQVDPDTGLRWIQYVKLTGITEGDIDAVSDVAACGDPTHPYPVGDLNFDCSVNLVDLALMAQNWLTCTYDCD